MYLLMKVEHQESSVTTEAKICRAAKGLGFRGCRYTNPRDPSIPIQSMPTLNPQVYKYSLHWATWILIWIVELQFCGKNSHKP